jgi:hypothetical protein
MPSSHSSRSGLRPRWHGDHLVYPDGRVWRRERYLTRADGVTRLMPGGWVATRIRRGNKGNGGGYVYVDLYEDGASETWLLHRLIACVFLENPEGKCDVNHKDGNRSNNHVSNLEWCTRSENQLHAHRVLNRRRGYAVEPRVHP